MKWDPAVLRSYDITGMHVGARPLYAVVFGDERTRVEILWQELVDFKSMMSERMGIKGDGMGMTATRGPGVRGEGTQEGVECAIARG